ncbi:MAG: 50S ribosomal protein L2 [Candidatus Altiarchaeota archaeon]|nr:50S ribosomal protein L2 [Candidatus Altiarchaeota archaeon]
MGKNLNQQRRGKGSPTFKTPSHRFMGKVKLVREPAVVIDLVRDPARSAPAAKVKIADGTESLMPATIGMYVGQTIEPDKIESGNIAELNKMPAGTKISFIELRPGDGGKLVRSAGSSATLIAVEGKTARIKMPSGMIRSLPAKSRALIGVIAGIGMRDKPILKAGKMFHMMKARNKYWPRVASSSMNAVEHPFGGGRKQRHVGKPQTTSRHAPPGRKVGSIAARQMGRKKRGE